MSTKWVVYLLIELETISEFLKNNTSLKYLGLPQNKIGNADKLLQILERKMFSPEEYLDY